MISELILWVFNRLQGKQCGLQPVSCDLTFHCDSILLWKGHSPSTFVLLKTQSHQLFDWLTEYLESVSWAKWGSVIHTEVIELSQWGSCCKRVSGLFSLELWIASSNMKFKLNMTQLYWTFKNLTTYKIMTLNLKRLGVQHITSSILQIQSKDAIH